MGTRQPLSAAVQACNRHTVYCVPLYDSLGENAIEFIIHQAEVSLACTAGDKMAQLVKAIPKIKDTLKVVVYWGTADSASIQVGLIWLLPVCALLVRLLLGI